MTVEMTELLKSFKSQVERDKVLDELREIEVKQAQYEMMETEEETKKWEYYDELHDQVKKEYKSRLPIQSLSVCPFCGATFQLEMDPFGYAGDWWPKRPRIKNQCPHYVVLREVINLNGHRAQLKPNSSIQLGPEVPYVIKRLFKIPTMTCVIARLDLPCGYTYYPMTYFAENPPPPNEVKCGRWASEYHGGFEVVSDSWHFDIRAFVESGQLRWATIKDTKVTLQPLGVETFPFLDMSGHQGIQLAQDNEIKLCKAPRASHSVYDGSGG